MPHTPDTARTLALSGRNCLVVNGMAAPPPKIGYRRAEWRRGEMCLVAYLCAPTDDVDVGKEYQLIPIDSL